MLLSRAEVPYSVRFRAIWANLFSSNRSIQDRLHISASLLRDVDPPFVVHEAGEADDEGNQLCVKCGKTLFGDDEWGLISMKDPDQLDMDEEGHLAWRPGTRVVENGYMFIAVEDARPALIYEPDEIPCHL